MKQNNCEIDLIEDLEYIEKKYQKLLEPHYNSNLVIYANTVKKCIPQLDTHYENKFIRKIDKLWVQTNLNKLLPKTSDKLEKALLSKNTFIKNTIDSYRTDFHSLSPQLHSKIRKSHYHQTQNELANRKKSNTFPFRNSSFSFQNINTEPSTVSINANKTLGPKRIFRVRQLKTSFQQTMTNISRYGEKPQKVKVESTFAQFFFQKETNPEQGKTLIFDKNRIDKVKIMTNIRWSFNPSKKLLKAPKLLFQTDNQNLNKYLGLEVKRQSYYKPKSKCHAGNNKVFLHF